MLHTSSGQSVVVFEEMTKELSDIINNSKKPGWNTGVTFCDDNGKNGRVLHWELYKEEQFISKKVPITGYPVQ